MTREFAIAIIAGAMIGAAGGYFFGWISLVVTAPVGLALGYISAAIDNECDSK